MAQALYRNYRPRSLSEVIGQEHITETLARALQAGRISHAYLLTGPRGVGKTSIARILAYEINKIPYDDTQQLDIIEIDAASNRRIDDIRDLREKVHIAPVNAKYKVYIIDEVHMLTGESFNALLKTLEEPPSHVIFILATTEVHKLPATIISRTQRYSFRPVDQKKVIAHLKTIAKREKIDITDDALAIIAERGEGSFRDSISLLDQLAHVSTNKITADDVTNMLGLAPKAALDGLVDALLANNHKAVTTHLTSLETSGSTPATLVQQLTSVLGQKATTESKLYGLIDQLLEVPRAYNPSLKLLTTLMLFMQPATPKDRVQPAATKPAPPVITIEAKPKELREHAAEVKEAPAVAPKPAAKPEKFEPISSLSAQDWGKVLAAVKKLSPPMHGVLKLAQPVLEDDGRLTLKFKYPLHSKKIDDAKQKAVLAEIIQTTLGVAPSIVTSIDKTAMPPVISADPTVTSVAAIMGGGEIIDAPAA